MPGVEMDKLPPAVKNGATDYLLMKKTVINPIGNECNKAGISYKGFARQPNRCDVEKGTCLENQPLDFWESDNEKRKTGQKGAHLLQNYGTPYKDPIIINKETKEHWLALEYYDDQRTMLTIEFNADDITILTPGKNVQISKVITESTEKKITFYVYLTNKDLSPTTLFAKAIDCQFGVPDSTNETSLVPPQNREELVLDTQPGKIELFETLKCTVVAGSGIYGVVARREVLVKPLHRCICYYHCLCKCMGESLTCEPMEIKDFHAAGFRGSLPILTAKPPHRVWIVAHPFLAILAFLLLLLLLGLVKGLCGVMGYKRISYYGLRKLIYGKRTIKHYHEKDLKKRDVVYNNDGYPINPDTKKPVRAFSEEIILAMNAFFLCIWPYMKIVDWLGDCKKEKKDEDVISTDDESSLHETDDTKFKPSLKHLHNRISNRVSEHPQHPPPQRPGDRKPQDAPNAENIRSGRSLRNTISDSALESNKYRSDPDLSVLQKEQANWQKGAHMVQHVKK
ncbi:unnamed protein product [Larinioides sclopetarius]|uniref:Generative cell specific-1/HAP2 domain-containing protein n=1 Tax=Larinioides sclopetarius TaxID=280406 RepID=A0AAV2BGS3_9ARAC